MEKIHDMIVIGGGPAGYTAALYAARAGLDVVIIEKMSVGGQMAVTDTIDNYSGFDEGVSGWELGMKMQAGAERFGAVTKYGEVVSVELEGRVKKVKTSPDELLSRTVVIATGANPRELGVDREEKYIGRGVHYCAHCDGRFYKDKTVVVVGGGNSAVSDALYLSNLASLNETEKRLINPHYYKVDISDELYDLKMGLINNIIKEIKEFNEK